MSNPGDGVLELYTPRVRSKIDPLSYHSMPHRGTETQAGHRIPSMGELQSAPADGRSSRRNSIAMKSRHGPWTEKAFTLTALIRR